MDRAPHDDPWCVVSIIRRGTLTVARIPESCAEKARELGWTVLIRDSEMPVKTEDVEPSQRNPNRSGDE